MLRKPRSTEALIENYGVKAMNEEKYFLVALNCIPGLRGRRFHRLLEIFGSPERLWKADRQELYEKGGVSSEFIETFFEQKQTLCPEKEFDEANKYGAAIFIMTDEAYPDALREIHSPPPVLYVKGDIGRKPLEKTLGIVGSRKATQYGLDMAEKLAEGLASSGFTIVSGLARGIDTRAHEGALKAGGKTFAVLGCGLDISYPKENKALSEKIATSGAVLTEFPFGTQPLALNFPLRNRIVSGLSRGVIVVQAGERSGATITADFALEQGKDVFAVPGSVFLPQSKGTHRLLKEGAMLVESVSDVLDGLGFSQCKIVENTLPPLQGLEKQVFDVLSYEPVVLDDLVEVLNFPVQRLSGVLMILESRGYVSQLPGKFFMKSQ